MKAPQDHNCKFCATPMVLFGSEEQIGCPTWWCPRCGTVLYLEVAWKERWERPLRDKEGDTEG